MNHYKLNRIYLAFLAMCMPVISWAQEASEAKPEVKSSFAIDVNTALTLVAVLLLIPIIVAARTSLKSIKGYAKTIQKSGDSHITKLILFIFFMGSQCASAATKEQPFLTESTFTYVLLLVILVEIIILISLISSAGAFVNILLPENVKKAISTNEIGILTRFKNWWNKSNNFIPITEESKLDTGHDYDGIRELDNITPPWFTAAFVASIIFAIVYLYTRHVSHSSPLQFEEFEIEMTKAAVEKEAFLASQANKIDETNVAVLSGSDLIAGKELFVVKCASCHGENGGSKPGGVGPNLTDPYWIHGGSLKDIFVSIKNGWPEKGMISWKEQLTPMQIAQVSSYIKSIKGSVASGGREPQGQIYTELSITKDSVPNKEVAADTTKKEEKTN